MRVRYALGVCSLRGQRLAQLQQELAVRLHRVIQVGEPSQRVLEPIALGGQLPYVGLGRPQPVLDRGRRQGRRRRSIEAGDRRLLRTTDGRPGKGQRPGRRERPHDHRPMPRTRHPGTARCATGHGVGHLHRLHVASSAPAAVASRRHASRVGGLYTDDPDEAHDVSREAVVPAAARRTRLSDSAGGRAAVSAGGRAADAAVRLGWRPRGGLGCSTLLCTIRERRRWLAPVPGPSRARRTTLLHGPWKSYNREAGRPRNAPTDPRRSVMVEIGKGGGAEARAAASPCPRRALPRARDRGARCREPVSEARAPPRARDR